MHYRKDIARRPKRALNSTWSLTNSRRQAELIGSNRTEKAKVGILMGSDSDLEVMREAEKRLDSFGIAYETRIMSAHRTPDKAAEYAATASSAA